MERLTKKENNGYQLKHIDWTTGVQRAMQKLGELEDIETDIGLDFRTMTSKYTSLQNDYASILSLLFDANLNKKVLKIFNMDVIYVKDYLNVITKFECSYGFTINTKLKCVCLSRNYYFEDYGTTWAFTEEELEDDD